MKKSKENPHLSAMKEISKDNDSGFKKQLIDKIELNSHLTGTERKYIVNFLRFHENCSSAVGSTDKEIRSTNGDIASNLKRTSNDDSGSSRKKKKMVDVGTQSRTYVNDYEYLKNFLRDYEKKDPEEQNEEEFCACSDMLFDERRAYIMSVAPTVKVFKERHPYMFKYKQVIKELELITGKPDLYTTFTTNVKKYSHLILEHVPKTPSLKMIKNKIDGAKHNEKKNWFRMTASLLLLPKYMDEERKGILLCNDETSIQKCIYPYIYYAEDTSSCLEENASFKIFIEGIELCTADNLLDAVFALLATYYMFNAVYPPNCAKSFALLECLYLEYTDTESGSPSTTAVERIKFLEKKCNAAS